MQAVELALDQFIFLLKINFGRALINAILAKKHHLHFFLIILAIILVLLGIINIHHQQLEHVENVIVIDVLRVLMMELIHA